MTVSVVAGARVLAAADDSVTVWAAARDMGAGDTVSADDVVVRHVRFDQATDLDRYFGGEAALPEGLQLVRGVGAGELVITVPEGVAIEVDAHAGVGEIDIVGELDDGIDVDVHRTLILAGSQPDAPLLQLEADVGFGSIEVRRG